MTRRTRLLITNIPVTCSEEVITDWIQSNGYAVRNVSLIRDLVSGTSPSFAYADLTDPTILDCAQNQLDGLTLNGHSLQVRRVVPLLGLVSRARRGESVTDPASR